MKRVQKNKHLELTTAPGLNWEVLLYDEKKGVVYKRTTTNNAERAMVDKFAEQVYKSPDKKVDDISQKEIIKWVKEGEQKPFVYVLLTESSYDYESSQNVRCFKSLNVAQKEMKDAYKAELADWKSSYEKDFIENGITNTTAYINEDGDFTRNHITWEIYAEEIN